MATKKCNNPKTNDLRQASRKLNRHAKDNKSNRRDKNTSMEEDRNDNFRNDPKWYYINPTITDNAIRINFEEFVGQPYAVGSNSTVAPLMVLSYLTQPMPNRSVSDWNYEYTKDPGAGWAARKLYAALSSITGRTVNYNPTTLVMMFYAIGEMLSMYAYIRRVFGYYRTYNRRNWGIPRSLFSAMGVDYDDFASNIANYLTEFNTIVVDMNKMPILGSVSYFQKCVAMYDDVFADLSSDMAQLYMLTPGTTWVLQENATDAGYPDTVAGSVLQTVNVAYSTGNGMASRTLGEILTILRNQVNALLTSTTYNIVYSDILNYASKMSANVLVIPQIGIDFSQTVKFNEKMNQQMHHAMQVGYPDNSTTAFTDPRFIEISGIRNMDGSAITITATRRNDIVEDIPNNSYIYNPITHLYFNPSGVTDVTDTYWDYAVLQTLLYDADHIDESLDERVDNTRYMITREKLYIGGTTAPNFDLMNYTTSGDHAVIAEWMITSGGSEMDLVRTRVPVAYTGNDIVPLARMQALDLPPLTWAFNTVKVGDTGTGLAVAGTIGDLKDVTILNPSMLKAANKLIERDLLEVRDLKGFSG